MKQTLLLILAVHLFTAALAQPLPNFAWTKTIALVTLNSTGEIFDFCTDPAGNSYVYGPFSGALNFGSTGSGSGNVTLQTQGAVEAYFVAKYAPNGVLDWARKIVAPNNGTIYDADFSAGGISADLSGNVYISGQFSNPALNFGDGVVLQRSCAGSCSDFFLAKYNADGQAQWVTNGAGNPDTYQTATHLATGMDGSLFVAGNYGGQSVKLGTAPSYDNLEMDGMYMAHFSNAGLPLAAWFFSNGGGDANLEHLAITPQNRLLVTGTYDDGLLDFGNGVQLATYGGANAYNFFVAEYDDQGAAQWAYNLNTDNKDDLVSDISSDISGRPYVVADFANVLSSGYEEIAATQPPYKRTGILMHLSDSIFQPVMAVPYNVTVSNPVANVTVDKNNRYFVSGFFTDTEIKVDTFNFLNANPNCDDILLFSGAADTLQWARSAGGGGCEAIFSVFFGRAISTDDAGNLYAIGSYHASITLDNFTRNGDGLFVTKLNTATVGTNEPLNKEQNWLVQPNPSQGDFRVEQKDFFEPALFRLYDAQGRLYYQRMVNQADDLDFQLRLPAGLYTLQRLTKGQAGQEKVLIIH